MNRRLKQAGVVIVIVFAAAQFISPKRANPATDASRTIRAQLGPASTVPAIVERACGDCHSNNTVWPWYAKIAPLSWLMAGGVKEGRKVVNFSEWGSYNREMQRTLLSMSCEAVSKGRMPGSAWTTLHPEAKLTKQDIAAICAAAHGGSDGN